MEVSIIISCLTGFEFAEWGDTFIDEEKVNNAKRMKKVTEDRKCFVWANRETLYYRIDKRYQLPIRR